MRLFRFIWGVITGIWEFLSIEWRYSRKNYTKELREAQDRYAKAMCEMGKEQKEKKKKKTVAGGKAILKREYAAKEKGKTYTVREYEVPSPGASSATGVYVVPMSEETKELAAGKWDHEPPIIDYNQQLKDREEEKARTFEHPVHDIFSVIAKEGEDPLELKDCISKEYSKEDPTLEITGEELTQVDGFAAELLDKARKRKEYRSEHAEQSWKDLADVLHEATNSGRSRKTLDDIIDEELEKREK